MSYEGAQEQPKNRPTIIVGSTNMSDKQFLGAFLSLQLPLSCFRHGDHLRFAWLNVHLYPLEEAVVIVNSAIKAYADHHKLEKIYHETITIGWVRLIATHRESNFGEFLVSNEEALGLSLLFEFWTRDLLMSSEARVNWIPPDKKPLPIDTV